VELEFYYKIISKWFNGAVVMMAQYFLFTGIVFLTLYVWKKKKLWHTKIQQRYPKNKHVFLEIRYSIYTFLILSAFIAFVIWANKNGLTMAYSPIDKYGYGYYFLSFLIMIVVHDTYFYWTHRLLHWKPLFKFAHKIHHKSINPTPFAAYSFHPFEAMIEMGIMLVLVFTIPHHISVISVFGIYSLVINVAGHAGFEFLPKWFVRHKIFKWHNTSTHHNLHHTHFKSNFGLYFTFWDKVMKTEHPKYEEEFEKLADFRDQAKEVADGPLVEQRQVI